MFHVFIHAFAFGNAFGNVTLRDHVRPCEQVNI